MAPSCAASASRRSGSSKRIRPDAHPAVRSHGESLHELAFGRDESPVEPFALAKSMGAENTFAVDCRDPGTLATTLREQAERVGRELRGEHLAAAGSRWKLRFADFRTVTRAWTGEPTQDGLRSTGGRRRCSTRARHRAHPIDRLSSSSFQPEATGQLPLLDTAAVRRERLARATDALARRFGQDTVVPAAWRKSAPAAGRAGRGRHRIMRRHGTADRVRQARA